jgi:hypothetical protein
MRAFFRSPVGWALLFFLLIVTCLFLDKCAVPTWNSRIAKEHQVIENVVCATLRATWDTFECDTYESHPEPILSFSEHLSRQFSVTIPSKHYVYLHFSSFSERKRVIYFSLQERHDDGTLSVFGSIEVFLDVIDQDKVSITKIRARDGEFTTTIWRPQSPLIYSMEQ